MKKVLLLMMVVLFSSCGTMKYYETSFNLNLKEYTGDDFSINPSSLSSGDFEPLGLVSNEFFIGASVGKEYKDVVYKETPNKYSGMEFYYPKLEHMFDVFITNAKSIGANGIVDFDFKKIYNGDLKNPQLIGYKIEGVAVKFK